MKWTLPVIIALAVLSLVMWPGLGMWDEDPLSGGTCGECRDEEECNRLCGVGPCSEPGQAGCWMPEWEVPSEEECKAEEEYQDGCICDGAQGECRRG